MTCRFVSLGLSTGAIEPRILSALLKEQGHRVKQVLLPSLNDLRREATGSGFQYREHILREEAALCRTAP